MAAPRASKVLVIAPTILTLFGFPVPPDMQGSSIA